jgi:hypothetical protein
MAAHAHSDAPDRYHPRVAANLMVTVRNGPRALLAKAKDLSMAGVFVWGDPGPLEEQVTVTIPLPDGSAITAPCAVARAQDEGVALKFGDLDWDDLIALARYLHPRLP